MIREVVVRYSPSSIPVASILGRMTSSRDIYMAFREEMLAFPVEVFRVLFLDTKNVPIAFEDVSRGCLNNSVAHPREVFWSAVYHRAAAIIVMHNHPSGDCAPSAEDRACTVRLVKAGKILGIRVLDHVVFGLNDYYSFADAVQLEVDP